VSDGTRVIATTRNKTFYQVGSEAKKIAKMFTGISLDLDLQV